MEALPGFGLLAGLGMAMGPPWALEMAGPGPLGSMLDGAQHGPDVLGWCETSRKLLRG